MMTLARASLAGLAATLAAVTTGLFVHTGPAAAHPFGPPSTARVSVDGTRVSFTWLAAEDDWVVLGQHVGAFGDPAAGTVSRTETGEQKIQRAPAVRGYLLDRIRISQDGRPCTGQVLKLEKLLTDGARLAFDCPTPVSEVDITLSMLIDLNDAYRTVLSTETPADPAQALFTSAEQTRRLRFSRTRDGTHTAVLGVGLGTGAVLLLGAGVLVLRRGRAR